MSDSPSSEQDPKTLEGQPEGAPETPGSATPEEEYIQLNAKQLNNELIRLERENEQFRGIFNSRVGSKAAAQYKPIIAAREQEIENLKREIRRRDIQAMSEQDIETKFASDPAFAKEYAEIIHSQPASTPEVDESPMIEAAINEALDTARAYGLSEEIISKITHKATEGGYEQDGAHWTIALQRMNQDIMSEVLKAKSPAAAPSISNPSLSKAGGPDLSPSDRKSGSVLTDIPKTAQEFNKLPLAKQKEILSTAEGIQAVQALTKT